MLSQMMHLTAALIANQTLYLEPYAPPLSAPVLTCLMSRKLGTNDGIDSTQEQYELRRMAASLMGQISKNYAKSNTRLRPKLTRTCLKFFLDPSAPASVLYGAILGLSAAGGPEAVRILVVPNLKNFDSGILQNLRDRGVDNAELETLVQAVVNAVRTIVKTEDSMTNGVNGGTADQETLELTEFVGSTFGSRIAALNNHRLNKAVLEVKQLAD